MRASRSIRYFPTRAAYEAVPHATKLMRGIPRTNVSSIFRLSSKTTRPLDRSTRPRRVSEIARGCSLISLSRKCLYPDFAAAIGSQVIVSIFLSIFSPVMARKLTESFVMMATSPWSRKLTLRVCSRSAGASEARKFSPSPYPTITPPAFEIRAATIFPGSFAEMNASAAAPSSRGSTARAASSSVLPCASSSSRRCTATSVSVSLVKRWPFATSGALSISKFSMIPLWITAVTPPQSTCGCAFCSLGRPWVAQRV